MGILTNRRRRMPTPVAPAELGERDGLAYALWLPDEEPRGGVVIVHGAGSCKESHFDFGRAARAAGLAALAYDMRGHGDSEGRFDGRVLADAATMAAVVTAAAGGGSRPLALRGSSMGGYIALLAARELDAAAVVAICPAGADHLLRGLRNRDFEFEVDDAAAERFLSRHDLGRAVAELRTPMLLLHAEGDERIPSEHSAEIYRAASMPMKRLLVLPGGHHRSIQHDAELQGESLRFIGKAFAAAS